MNIASVATLAMTAVLIAVGAPVITAICTRIVAWFFGSKSRVAFVALGVGGLLVLMTGRDIGPYYWRSAALYETALEGPRWFTGIAHHWFDILLEAQTWRATSSFGFLAGAAWVLLRADWHNSPNYRVFSNVGRARPSPWARIRGGLVARYSAAVVAGAITIGVEMSSGKPVRISAETIRRHLLVLGRSGRGKTETVMRLAFCFAELGLPILFLDGKGDREVRQALATIANQVGRAFFL